ncbi:hypothetical protein [Elizabethkingia anophelis]|uniref:hypothetical protein n=1 Tax=Elizabethkingia anophelis TaxID=1117645 RepID=UPI0013FD0BE3|nr:hypothetical protein [Elizabethkingia anophelis]MYY43881.1 hypothetical protein [Elizabethkingia anophelis]
MFKSKEEEKKEYEAPTISVIEIEMEQGIASGSATVTPGVTNGNTDAVSTVWGTKNPLKSIDSEGFLFLGWSIRWLINIKNIFPSNNTFHA